MTRQELTAKQAYQKGWDASYNTKTYDMEGPESRFVERFGSAQQDMWNAGWTDYASGYPKWSSYRDPEGRMSRQQAREMLARCEAGLRWAREALAADDAEMLAEAMVEVTGAAATVQDAVENDGIEGVE